MRHEIESAEEKSARLEKDKVAKEAAQIVVLEDDFASIVHGIREGRAIFENMKKAISYCLIGNIPELIPFLCPDPTQCPNPAHISWIKIG